MLTCSTKDLPKKSKKIIAVVNAQKHAVGWSGFWPSSYFNFSLNVTIIWCFFYCVKLLFFRKSIDNQELMMNVEGNKSKYMVAKMDLHENFFHATLKVTFSTKYLLLVIKKVNRPWKISYSLKVSSPSKTLLFFGHSASTKWLSKRKESRKVICPSRSVGFSWGVVWCKSFLLEHQLRVTRQY